MPKQDQIEKQVFRVDEDWSRKEKRRKENVFDEVFKERPLQLRKAREAMDALQDPFEDDASVIGWLYFFAYNTLNAAVNQARISDDDSRDKLEDLVDEFWETLYIDGRQLTPYDLKEFAAKSQELPGTYSRLNRVMKKRGSKIHQLIGFAFAGTEAVKDGSSGSVDRITQNTE